MRILFLSPEVAPFAKTGGLADVAGALPKWLAALGHHVAVMLPAHRSALAAEHGAVDTGEAVVFSEGSLLRDVVRASCSFPGVFPPFSWEGRRLVDGGVSEVVPVRRAREMAGDAGVVVAIDCNAGGRWPAADSFIAIALRAGLTMVRGRTRSELTGADFVISPTIGESGWMRPDRIPRFAEAGEESLAEALPELRRLLGD